MNNLIENIRHICIRSGVTETVTGAICHEIQSAMLPTEEEGFKLILHESAEVSFVNVFKNGKYVITINRSAEKP